MAGYTPRPRQSLRPSFGTASPSLLEKASTSMHRKASYNALVGQFPNSPASGIGQTTEEFSYGDVVDVPGDMYGVVKFIGSVQGKQGRFLGVELDDRFASKGKNSGDVDGISYFATSIPGAGIFLPLHRAHKRSLDLSDRDRSSDTQDTSFTTTTRTMRNREVTPESPTIPKFTQTVGPRARPSLPRPESPVRRQSNIQATPGRQFSQSLRLGGQLPTTPNVSRTTASKPAPPIRTPVPARPFSRTGSTDTARKARVSDATNTASNLSIRSSSRLGNHSNDEILVLQSQLANKERQLAEQAHQLQDMESSLKEIQAMMPDSSLSSRKPSINSLNNYTTNNAETDVSRRTLQEKNDKITSLIAEFDGHRADFRATIETLESASNETVRVYELRIADLLSENQDLRDSVTAQQDVESIAAQLKALEELVAELEDGLEDARRGEAEARGEVEFLRGEVERGRSELRREREKASPMTDCDNNHGSMDRDELLRGKDAEIKTLIAALEQQSHLMTNGETSSSNHLKGSGIYSETDMTEMNNLRTVIQDLRMQNNSLQEQLHVTGHNQRISPTAQTNGRSRFAINVKADKPATKEIKDSSPTMTNIRCEGCDQIGHDILHCDAFNKSTLSGKSKKDWTAVSPRASPMTSTVKLNNQADPNSSPVHNSNKTITNGNADKWCALCEQDGHLAFDCPNDQY